MTGLSVAREERSSLRVAGPARFRSLAALAAALVALAPLGAIGQTPPYRHDEGAITGPIVETPDAIKVTGTIQCWCGGCVNQTLHECTCGLAAAERKKVAEALTGGKTPDELIAAYVTEHGEQVRIVPEKRGLNLVGWAVPFAAAILSMLALTMVLVAWRRRGLQTTHEAGPARGGAASPAERAYRDRLERELEEFES